MDFSCSHLTLDGRKMRSAALLGQSWLMPFFECWMWRKRTSTDDLVIQNPSHVCVYNSHCMHWYSNLWCDLLKMKDTYLITKSKYSHSFPGLSTVSKRAVRIGGVWNRSCIEMSFASATKECFALQRSARVRHVHRTLLRPPRWFSMPTWGENHTLFLFLLHQKCLNYSLWIFRTPFFFSIFWEFNLGFLCAWRIWWQWWGVARAVPSPWAQQFHLRGQWNGGLISTDKLKIIDPLMVLCQVNCCILNWIYLHILITHCTMTITISCTLIVCIYVYTARIYSQYSTFLLDLPLTPQGSPISSTLALLNI